MTNKLDEEKKGYNRAIVKKNFHKNKQQLLIKMNYNEKFKMLDEQISNIVKVKKSKFNQFLKKNAEKLISYNNEVKNEAIINGKKDKEKYKEILENLVKYMNLKIHNLKIEELSRIINSKKMIII